MTHAIGHKPVYKPAPDIGCCAKFSAFLVGTAGVAGLMAAAFSGPLAKPIADAAGNAMTGTASKVMEAVGLNLPLGEPGMLKTGGAAYFSQEMAGKLHHQYRQECSYFTQDLECAVKMIGSVALTVLAVGLVFAVAAMATGLWCGRKPSNSISVGILNKQ